MINSMTGFGSQEGKVAGLGTFCVEIRSTNHKFLEIVLHLPQGLFALEDKIKKEIESCVKRGRITCIVSVSARQSPAVFINRPLLVKYIRLLKETKRKFSLQDEISVNSLIQLPGVLALEDNKMNKAGVWRRLKLLLGGALEDFTKMRRKEGEATCSYLKNRARAAESLLVLIHGRFPKAVQSRISRLVTNEERSAFLKDSDIAEEIQRLSFHIRNFKDKLSKTGPIGKELDFIAQEMQREANTLSAKSFDTAISSWIIQIKSQIEMIREQAQNIE
jgi:uncharacterized protein (TIGR00255 family)